MKMADTKRIDESVKKEEGSSEEPTPLVERSKPNPMIRRFADDEEDAVDDKDTGLVLRERTTRGFPLSRFWLPVEKVQASGEIVTEWVLAPEGVVYCAWCKTGTDHNVYYCKDMDWTKGYCGLCDSVGHQDPDCSEMEPFLGCTYEDDY